MLECSIALNLYLVNNNTKVFINKINRTPIVLGWFVEILRSLPVGAPTFVHITTQKLLCIIGKNRCITTLKCLLTPVFVWPTLLLLAVMFLLQQSGSHCGLLHWQVSALLPHALRPPKRSAVLIQGGVQVTLLSMKQYALSVHATCCPLTLYLQ